MKSPLMIGTPGLELDDDEAQRLQTINPQALILFTRNFASVTQIKDLIKSIKQILGQDILIAVDHEGGRVVRFKEGLPNFPAPRDMAKKKNPHTVYDYSLEAAHALVDWGINFNLAPVVDIFGEGTHERMYSRTFGNDSDIVSDMATAFIEAMNEGGVKSCAKHFPGSQFANLDPHEDLPIVKASKAEQDEQLKPFQAAIAAGVGSIMISHMIYLCYDKEYSATLSKKIVTGLLREQLGYQGMVLSDDLEMGAIAKKYSMSESIPLSLAAGCDLVLSCNQVELQQQAFEAIKDFPVK